MLLLERKITNLHQIFSLLRLNENKEGSFLKIKP